MPSGCKWLALTVLDATTVPGAGPNLVGTGLCRSAAAQFISAAASASDNLRPGTPKPAIDYFSIGGAPVRDCAVLNPTSLYLLSPLRTLKEVYEQAGRNRGGAECPICPLADLCEREAARHKGSFGLNHRIKPLDTA